MSTRYWRSALCACAMLSISGPLAAQEEPSGFHADAEIDPLSYATGGHSVHVGVGYRRIRVDFSAFALDYPGFLEPTDGLQSSMNGFGIKVQVFPFWEQRGGFIGVQAELTHTLLLSERSTAAWRGRSASVAINVGWRFMLLADLYVSPWLLFSYDLAEHDVQLDGLSYHSGGLNAPFPVLHIGYRFR